MRSSRRIRDPDYEDHGIIVKDIDEANRRMEIIQSRIDMAEMMGIGTSEYEKRAARPVHLGKSLVIDSESGRMQFIVHTIQQSISREGDTIVCLDMDVMEGEAGK